MQQYMMKQVRRQMSVWLPCHWIECAVLGPVWTSVHMLTHILG